MANKFSIPLSLPGVAEAFADYAKGDELAITVLKKTKDAVTVECEHEGGDYENTDVPDEVMDRAAAMSKGY